MKTVTTRNAAADLADESDGTVDLSEAGFISRAAVDEFLAHAAREGTTLLVSEDVRPMFDAVNKGRVDSGLASQDGRIETA